MSPHHLSRDVYLRKACKFFLQDFPLETNLNKPCLLKPLIAGKKSTENPAVLVKDPGIQWFRIKNKLFIQSIDLCLTILFVNFLCFAQDCLGNLEKLAKKGDSPVNHQICSFAIKNCFCKITGIILGEPPSWQEKSGDRQRRVPRGKDEKNRKQRY